MATSRKSPLRGKELQRSIIDRARALGWRVAHFPPISTTRGGKVFWLTPVAADGKGFPDLLLLRERQVVVEVKGDGDRLKPEQADWLSAFRMAGHEAYVWTPAMWRSGEVEEVLRRRAVSAPLTWEPGDAALG